MNLSLWIVFPRWISGKFLFFSFRHYDFIFEELFLLLKNIIFFFPRVIFKSTPSHIFTVYFMHFRIFVFLLSNLFSFFFIPLFFFNSLLTTNSKVRENFPFVFLQALRPVNLFK